MSFLQKADNEYSPGLYSQLETVMKPLLPFLKSLSQIALVTLLIVSYAADKTKGQSADSTSVSEVIGSNNVLSLKDAIHIALANNSKVKRSLLNLEDAEEEVRIAWSEVLPDISLSADYTRNVEIPVNFIPAQFIDPDASKDELVPLQFGADNSWRGGLAVEQTLFRGEAIVGIGSSKIFKTVQTESLRATAQQVVTQTRTAYYSVLVAKEKLRLQQATVDRLKENLNDNKARQKAGLIDDYDVLQVKVELSNEKPKLTQAQYGVQEAYRELMMIMGVSFELDFSVKGDLNSYHITSQQAIEQVNKSIKRIDTMTPYQYQKDTSFREGVLGNRGDIRVLEKQNKLREQKIKAVKSRFLPTLSATYNLTFNAAQAGSPVFFGNKDNRARSQTIGLTLSLPIFQGFQRSANLSKAKIEKKDLEVQKRQALREAKNDIHSAREALNQAIETAPARKEALELAQEGYDRAISRYESGLGSQLDVRNAEVQLRNAEVNYAQMVYNYLSAKAKYDLAIGKVPFVDSEGPKFKDE